MNTTTPASTRPAVRQAVDSALRALHAAGGESLEAAARVLAVHGRGLLGCDCTVAVIHPARPDRFRVVAGAGPWAETVVGSSYPITGTLHGRALDRREPVVTDDVLAETPLPGAFPPGVVGCGLLVPLRARLPLPDGRPGLGVVAFWRPPGMGFGPGDATAGRELVDVAGATLARDELLRAYRATTVRLADAIEELEAGRGRMEQAHGRALEALTAVSRHVDAGGSVAEFFGQMSATIAGLIGAERVGFARLTPRGTLRAQIHGFGLTDAALRGLGELRIREGGARGIERVVNEGTTAHLRLADIPRDDVAAPTALLKVARRDLAVTRWTAGDRVLGVVAAYDCVRPGGFTHEDAQVLEICARATGLVWEQVRSRRRARTAERRRAAEAAEHIERMRSIVGSALDAIVSVDADGVVVDLNHAAEELFGYPADAALGRSLADLVIPEELRERHLIALRRQAADSRPGIVFHRLEAPALRADGSRFDAEIAVVRTVADGRPLFTGFVRDVTEQHRSAEHEREQAARVAALEQAKTQLLNLASHELRAPLGVLNGYLAMIEEGAFGDVNDEMSRVVPLLRTKVGEMNLLVDGMLDAARIDDGGVMLTAAPLDLGELVVRAVEQVSTMRRDRDRVRVRVPEGPVVVSGDEQRLLQVVGNLVHNALKYSPGGEPVDVDLEARDGDAVVRVTDRGIGIDAADLPRLFTRFGRIVNRRNSHIPGTGLGLYLARELARMQGGDIGVTSTPRVGSVFALTLPLCGPGG